MENQKKNTSIKNILITLGMLMTLIAIVAIFIPYRYQTSNLESTDFKILDEKTDSLQLGETQTTKQGMNGQDNVTYETTGSLFQRLFISDQLLKSEISRTTVVPPTIQITSHGTQKYQYMYCSDGSYMYYTNEQFIDPNIGYTNKSADTCAQNGHGKEYMINNSPPISLPQIQSQSGGAICNDGWQSNSTGKGTCSHHGGVSYWL